MDVATNISSGFSHWKLPQIGPSAEFSHRRDVKSFLKISRSSSEAQLGWAVVQKLRRNVCSVGGPAGGPLFFLTDLLLTTNICNMGGPFMGVFCTYITSGWWFGTWILCFHFDISGIVIPTDFHSIIFQRGRSTTNQTCWQWWKVRKWSRLLVCRGRIWWEAPGKAKWMKKSSISIPFAQEIMNSHLRNCRNGPDPLHFWDVSSLGCSGFNDGAVGALLIFLLHVLPFSSGPKVISKNAYQMEFTSLDADYLPVIKHGNGKSPNCHVRLLEGMLLILLVAQRHGVLQHGGDFHFRPKAGWKR